MQATRHFERDPITTDDLMQGWRRLAQAVVLEAMRQAHGLHNLAAVDFIEAEASEGGWRNLAGIEGRNLFDFELAGCPRIGRNPRSCRMSQNV